MKNRLVNTLAILVLVVGPALTSLAQPNPNKQPSGDAVGGGPVGGNAPIGSGLILTIGMGIAYGIKKLSEPKTELTEKE
ncbi:MAG: hypothetical protein FD166_318 [Bacteroidetes bacterium]|nr:MAG: hypothetical protein FD166_318 [Bacteroidota bacterium]